MPTSFRPYQPDQPLLLPIDLREWLPPGHLSHFISDVIDELDLSVFYARYEGDGRRNRPYDPKMMLKVLLYAYAVGVFSSRKIARRLHEDVAFRYLSGMNCPSHRTICEFRHRHLGDFKEVFVKVLGVAREMGILEFGKVSIDGTKVRANASKRKAMSYGRMAQERERLEAEIGRLLERARQTDEAEDAGDAEVSADEDLPAELRRREARLEAIRGAQERLEAKQREADEARGRKADDDRKPKRGRPYKRKYGEPEAKAQHNFTDPESSIMKTSAEGYQQCYNSQVSVSEDSQLIVATEVGANCTDQGQLMPMVRRSESNCGGGVESVLADSGYANEADLQALEDAGIDGYVALGRESKQGSVGNRGGAARERMRVKLQTTEGRRRYGRRKWVSEAVNGWVKEVLGFRRFSVRGLDKVRGEWDLVSVAVNLKRMQVLQAG